MYCPIFVLRTYFLEPGFWFLTPQKHTWFTWQSKHAPLLTCLLVAPDGGREALIASQTKECEGSIKIIKVSFPANMQAAHEQTLKALLRDELHCDSPNGLFLFVKILLLSGALALERFVLMHRDVHPLHLCTFLCDFFCSKAFSVFGSFGQCFSPVGVAHNWLCVFTLDSLKWYHCSPQIWSMYYTTEL